MIISTFWVDNIFKIYQVEDEYDIPQNINIGDIYFFCIDDCFFIFLENQKFFYNDFNQSKTVLHIIWSLVYLYKKGKINNRFMPLLFKNVIDRINIYVPKIVLNFDYVTLN